MISFMLEYQRFLHALDHRIQVVWYAAHLLPVAFAFEWMIVTYPAATGRFRWAGGLERSVPLSSVVVGGSLWSNTAVFACIVLICFDGDKSRRRGEYQ